MNGLPDDFEPDEEEEQWIAEWEEAEREGVALLQEALDEHRRQPPPADALTEAAAAVRARMQTGGHPIDWVQQAAGPADHSSLSDAELLIRLTSATISPEEETGLEVEEEAQLVSLEMADWLGAIVGAVRAGPGANASPYGLVENIRTCPEVEIEGELDLEEESEIVASFWIVALPWEVLGLITTDQHLTEVGRWVLPRALARAWGGDFDQEPDQSQA